MTSEFPSSPGTIHLSQNCPILEMKTFTLGCLVLGENITRFCSKTQLSNPEHFGKISTKPLEAVCKPERNYKETELFLPKSFQKWIFFFNF